MTTKNKKNATRKPAARKATKPARFLQKGEKAAFTRINAKSASPVIIVCDHASNAMPRAAKNLGLDVTARKMHIAWDPGTAHIGRYLARVLNAPLQLANYSRLVVDLNRGEDHADCMRDTSDHVKIPGNKGLNAAQRQARLDDIYWPYHNEITRQLDAVLARGKVPLLLSIHSFTPEMDGAHRPWHIGVMWNRQQKLSKQLVKNLRSDNPALVIGENKPYSLKGPAGGKNTIERHCESRGLPYLIVEFRQDLVGGSKAEAEQWAELFLRSRPPTLDDAASSARPPGGKNAAAKKTTAAKTALRKPARKRA